MAARLAAMSGAGTSGQLAGENRQKVITPQTTRKLMETLHFLIGEYRLQFALPTFNLRKCCTVDEWPVL